MAVHYTAIWLIGQLFVKRRWSEDQLTHGMNWFNTSWLILPLGGVDFNFIHSLGAVSGLWGKPLGHLAEGTISIHVLAWRFATRYPVNAENRKHICGRLRLM